MYEDSKQIEGLYKALHSLMESNKQRVLETEILVQLLAKRAKNKDDVDEIFNVWEQARKMAKEG